MSVLKRSEVIQRLKDGEKMIEDRWHGYHYTINFDTVRVETARKLIKSKLVIAKLTLISPLLTRYIWNEEASK